MNPYPVVDSSINYHAIPNLSEARKNESWNRMPVLSCLYRRQGPV